MNILIPLVVGASLLIAFLLDRWNKRKSPLRYFGAVLVSFVIMFASSFVYIGDYVGFTLHIAVFVIGFSYLLLSTLHRLRDTGYTRWLVLLMLVPGLNLGFLLFCSIFPTKREESEGAS